MNRSSGLLVSLVASLLVASSPWADAGEPRFRFESRDCRFETSRVPGVECAVLFVPARWDRPSSTKPAKDFRLAVTRFRADPPRSDLPPVFFLSGGPGAPAVPLHNAVARELRRIADSLYAGRDLVLFDQRGTGRSYPRLDCPEAAEPHVWGGLAESEGDAGRGFAQQRDALRACLARFRDLDRDLGAFTSRESAADVDALRRALGYERIVLLGQSYGTRLALTVMARSPEIVSAAILDAVIPPQAPSGRLSTQRFSAALQRLFKACENHRSCGEAYPDLQARLARTLAGLYVEPMLLEIQNLKGIAPLYAKIDDVALLQIIFFEMHHRPGLQTLPMMIAGLSQGEFWRLKSHAENYFYGTERPNMAIGMGLSVECQEQFALASPRSQRTGAVDLPFLLNWGATLWAESPCHIWPVDPLPPADRAAAIGDMPVLLLAGAFDPTAPAELAELAAETLANSHLFVIPNAGHEVIGDSDCAGNILVDFLADPARRPSPDCLQDLPQPAFVALGGN